MSAQKPDDTKEPLKPEQEKSEVSPEETSKETAGTGETTPPELNAHETEDATERLLPVPLKSESKELASPEQLKASATKLPADETEWIPGERLELVRIPHPTVWPATLALGI